MKLDTDYSAETIREAMHLVDLGVTLRNVSRKLNVPYHQVRAWLRRYAECRSIEQIRERVLTHKPGRPGHVKS